MNLNKKAFTLIEILVVVLIIGILAAIAVPQYQKAVWRSRAKSMLPILRTMTNDIQEYYLANNVHPTKISDLDIEITGFTKPCIYSGARYTEESCVANEYSNLFINVVNGVGYSPFFYFNKGPYRSAGFYINRDTGKIICYEHGEYIPHKGDFCEKIMGCQESGSTYNDYYFNCPDL